MNADQLLLHLDVKMKTGDGAETQPMVLVAPGRVEPDINAQRVEVMIQDFPLGEQGAYEAAQMIRDVGQMLMDKFAPTEAIDEALRDGAETVDGAAHKVVSVEERALYTQTAQPVQEREQPHKAPSFNPKPV